MRVFNRCVAILGLFVLSEPAPPVIFTAVGGYPRTTLLNNGTTLLTTTQGNAPMVSCGLFTTVDSKAWRQGTGPRFNVLPGSNLANCAPGEAPDGALIVGVRHHDPNNTVFRIQSVRSLDHGHKWEAPVTAYATTLRDHAAWEPVFFKSLDGNTLRVAYSLERPADWTPPACEQNTNFPGADLPGQPQLAKTVELCQGRCVGESLCGAWSWRKSDHQCWLKTSKVASNNDSNLASGLKLCGAGVNLAAHPVENSSNDTLSEPAVERASARLSMGVQDRRLHSIAALQQDIVMQESTDSGRSWGPVRIISRTQGSRDGMPSIIRQKDGCLLCVFEGFGGTSWGHFTVRGVRSCDDGRTWVKQNIYPEPSKSTAHAPTVALLPDGRAVVSSYDEPHDLQLQFSEEPLVGTHPVNWMSPFIEVPGTIAWPNIFADSSGQLFVAYGRAGRADIAGPVSTSLKRMPLWV